MGVRRDFAGHGKQRVSCSFRLPVGTISTDTIGILRVIGETMKGLYGADMSLQVKWKRLTGLPKTVYDPDFCHGKVWDLAEDAVQKCTTEVPYPAHAEGVYKIWCDKCKQNALFTTWGRRDDVRVVVLPCLQS